MSLKLLSLLYVREEEARVHFPNCILKFSSGSTDLCVAYYRASSAVLLVVFRPSVGVEVKPTVSVFQVELGLPLHIAIDVIALALDLPVITAVAVPLVAKGTYLLAA